MQILEKPRSGDCLTVGNAADVNGVNSQRHRMMIMARQGRLRYHTNSSVNGFHGESVPNVDPKFFRSRLFAVVEDERSTSESTHFEFC